MLRIVVQTIDTNAATHVGSPPEVSVRTFEVDCPELERHIREAANWSNFHRQIIGAEVFGEAPKDTDEPHFAVAVKV